MKILRIIARLNVGGPARHVVWLTSGLRPMGYETLLVAGVVPSGEDDMTYFAEAAGVKPLILPEMSREISLKDFLAIWKLYRLMRREQPDIVHTHTAKAGTVGRLAGLIYRWTNRAARTTRFVHTYHGHVFHSYYGPFKTKLFLMIERVLARLVTDQIIVVSEQQRCEIHEKFRVGRSEQFSVIPLGLDLNMFEKWENRRPRLREELQLNHDDVLIGIIGRLTEVKNHDLFLRAAARLKEINLSSLNPRPLKFLMIGDGKLRAELKTQASALGLSQETLFLGTRDDPENFYPGLDIVTLTSLNEGTPLTLIEAMANARPVVATAVGGVVDLLGSEMTQPGGHADYRVCERGISAECGDVQALAEGLNALIGDPNLSRALGERGRMFVVQNYGKERLLRDMDELYQALTVSDPSCGEMLNG